VFIIYSNTEYEKKQSQTTLETYKWFKEEGWDIQELGTNLAAIQVLYG
jgi:hypothetical protein